MANPVTQFQILSRNPDKTAEFYTNLFGWVVIADNPLGCHRSEPDRSKGFKEQSGPRRWRLQTLFSYS